MTNCSCETGTCSDCANDMQNAIRQVRALHEPIVEGGQGYDEGGNYTYIQPCCTTCGTSDEYAVQWPCATIRALNGEEIRP